MEAKRMVIQESNKVRLSRIQSAVRKDVENARSKGNPTSIGEKKMSDYNRHLTDADVDIREWDTGDVLTEAVSWRTSKFDMRKRIFVLVGFLLLLVHSKPIATSNFFPGTSTSGRSFARLEKPKDFEL